MRRCIRAARKPVQARKALPESFLLQPHNANPESSWRRIANVSFPSAARFTFNPDSPDGLSF